MQNNKNIIQRSDNLSVSNASFSASNDELYAA
jgi:hypothetical protein